MRENCQNWVRLRLITCFVLVVCVGFTYASFAGISVTPRCRTFFADREHAFTIHAAGFAGKRLQWSLRYAGKTLAAGEAVVPRDGNVKIRFVFPKLNDGVVAAAEFLVTVPGGGESPGHQRSQNEGSRRDASGPRAGRAGETPALPGREKPEGRQRSQGGRILYFHSANPFVGYEKALEKLKISVWEPNGEGNLSKWLKSLGVRFAKVADLNQATGKILLVSGVDFESNPDIFTVLANIASKGMRVYVFNPSNGTVPLPINGVESIRLSDSGIIREVGKKLDAEEWGDARIADFKMRLAQFADGIGLELVKQAPNTHRTSATPFSFCAIRIGKGRLTMVTWKITEKAYISPTPALILKKWLLTSQK